MGVVVHRTPRRPRINHFKNFEARAVAADSLNNGKATASWSGHWIGTSRTMPFHPIDVALGPILRRFVDFSCHFIPDPLFNGSQVNVMDSLLACSPDKRLPAARDETPCTHARLQRVITDPQAGAPVAAYAPCSLINLCLCIALERLSEHLHIPRTHTLAPDTFIRELATALRPS